MVKPARATVSAAGTSNAERFVLKLGNTLSKRYNLLADVKVGGLTAPSMQQTLVVPTSTVSSVRTG